MALNGKGNKLIVGDEEGKISLLKLSKSFFVLDGGEDENKAKKEFIGKMFEREVTREKGIEQILKAKTKVVMGVDTKNIAKQEQMTRDRIRKIEEKYIPFVNSLMEKSEYNKESFTYIVLRTRLEKTSRKEKHFE
jgi:hypothetical protein